MSRAGKGFLYLIYFAAVAGLITAVVMSFRADRTSVATTSPTTRQGQGATHKTANQPKTTTSPSNGKTSSSNPAATAGSQAANTLGSTHTTGNANTLINTGPGSTISLFFIVSLLGFLMYRQLLISRIDRH